MSKAYRTTPEHTDRMPGGIPYIIGNEFAERFSFYGMKALLTVFMFKYLWLMGQGAGTPMSRAEAVENMHLFTFAVYITPFIGALLADLFMGKYRVIIWGSVIYCMGHAALAFMGTAGPSAGYWLFGGLALICFGAGGIKPCVSAHVGDQFGSLNRNLLTRVFNYFYWSINCGAFLSTLLTPWLLEHYGPHWAFGVPGVLMGIATLLFWMGRWKFAHVPAKPTIFTKELFSPHALKALGKLSIIYAFVAVFWALFDQTASSWVVQVDDMDRNWLGIEWLPSQVQFLNPILILTLIPLFTFVVYPLVDKVFPLTPLRKIGIGLFLMAAAFVLTAVVQGRIDAGGRPSFGWQALGFVLLTSSEVMVSIVCLEFSYTQAPRALKSLVMALFLASVALGNLFTAAVNHFAQVPDQIAAADEAAAGGELRTVLIPGADGIEGNLDDITVGYDEGFHRTTVDFPDKAQIKELGEQFSEWATSHENTVPSPEEGLAMLEGAADAWGNPIQYTVVSSRRARLWTMGGDELPKTTWDMGLALELDAPEPEPEAGEEEQRESWLDRRKRELGVDQSGQITDAAFFVGGQTRLEGAPYFWFFTKIMLVTAVLFVVVAIFYKPKEYLHDDEG